MQEELLRSLVWMDYRLAVLFTVILPLGLLVWAVVKRADSIQQLLGIYWKVSSLLAITVYLMIASFPISFITAIAAHILIPIGLWFWVDLNEEIDDQRRTPLKLAFTAWRWAVTVYMSLGAIAQIPFLQCAFSKVKLESAFCQVWLEPPLLYKEYLHNADTNGYLGFWGIVGLLIYTVYFTYFVVARLGRQGRSAIQQ
jgi:hypothetical protein